MIRLQNLLSLGLSNNFLQIASFFCACCSERSLYTNLGFLDAKPRLWRCRTMLGWDGPSWLASMQVLVSGFCWIPCSKTSSIVTYSPPDCDLSSRLVSPSLILWNHSATVVLKTTPDLQFHIFSWLLLLRLDLVSNNGTSYRFFVRSIVDFYQR